MEALSSPALEVMQPDILDPEPEIIGRKLMYQLEYSPIFPEVGAPVADHNATALHSYGRNAADREIGQGHYIFKESTRYSIPQAQSEGLINPTNQNAGELWRAYDHSLKRNRVIKFLTRKFRRNSDEVSLLFQEGRRHAQLEHPHIVKIFDIVLRPGENESVGLVLEELQPLPDNFTNDEFVQMAREVAQAIDYIHSQGYVHNDIALRNIMRAPNGTFKVIDFGNLQQVAEASSEKNRMILNDGDSGPLPERADQFRFADALLALQQFPQRVRLNDRQMDALLPIVRRAKHDDRAQRYGSCREMAEAVALAVGPA